MWSVGTLHVHSGTLRARGITAHPRRMLKKAVQQGRSERRPEAYPLGYVEDLNDARTKLTAFFSILLIGHLAFLEKLVQQRVFLFGVFVVLERLGKIVQSALALPLLGVVLGDAVISPRIFLIGLERPIEGFVGGLQVLFAQRQPADRRVCWTEVRIGNKSRVILFLCQIQTTSRFVETSQREMHFRILWVQTQCLFVRL